ncbi:universal stress protein [Trujillonella endophytica]|uniref:Nucleotide-binding universal stress protein, UspA family n=1 Tax=Trujillonella endophytica TaxID=673521 RepID=A0A1H8T0Z1_9ACTN|nr:universal stress protein [Trujillella endophytica]SEO84264.1 Nucleotide-binding universal stress protein, UspA family [Trujillella endophytica]
MATQQTSAAGDAHGGTDTSPERWVVGVDGSPGARAALVWALAAAARAGARLELVSTYPADFYWTDPYLLDTVRLDEIRADTAGLVRAALAEARRDPALAAVPGAAEVPTDVVVGGGAAAAQLVEQAQGAQRLVVGSRGRSGVRSTLLGSVALHCVAHAPCPVVVVHPGAVQPPPRVVVGIDDTDVSREALREAAEEARRLGAELEVVAACPLEVVWSNIYSVVAPPAEETRARARERAEIVVAEVLGADAPVRLRVEDGEPAEALPRVAAGAVLLVVGSRSRSRIAGMLLGSVALHCVVHAPCPVMVVHPQPARAAGRPAADPAAAAAR